MHNIQQPESTLNQRQEPFLRWKFAKSETTGAHQFESLQLSDGTPMDESKLTAAIKRSAGTENPIIAERILYKVALAMSSETSDQRLNDVSTLLAALQPQDETEALLLGQFIALQDSAFKCLSAAHSPGQGFYHLERFLALSHKLLNTANQTMQTLLKYRSGGQQTVQVVHVHNEGQAIVTQNLAANQAEGRGECRKK
ncbi:MAG TPA: hypothetical protein VGJ00_06285 [Rhabdochlamydiaceae bacterium]|jgi:hypothetical protein